MLYCSTVPLPHPFPAEGGTAALVQAPSQAPPSPTPGRVMGALTLCPTWKRSGRQTVGARGRGGRGGGVRSFGK